VWTLEIGTDTYQLRRGEGFRVTESIDVGVTRIEITATPAPTGAFNCYDENDDRLTGTNDASGAYGFEVAGEALNLKAAEDDEPCPLRRFLLEREWTRG
jgi:hypothetical protein